MRIISLAPSNTEILFALGAGEDIIARTAYCDYPKEALRIPKVGDWVSPSIDEIIRLKPDLILTSTIVQEGLSRRLRSEGLRAEHLDPRDLASVFKSIYEIGSLVGAEDEADSLVMGMLSVFSALEGHQREGRKPRLYIEEWHDPPFVSGNWVPEIAEIAGAEYGLIRAGERSRAFSVDEIRRFDPEIIILSVCGVRLGPEAVLGRGGWGELGAVRTKRVFPIDDSLLNRPGPRLAQGARRLAGFISSWRTSA